MQCKYARDHARDMQKQVKGIVKLSFHAFVDDMSNDIVNAFNGGPIKEVHENIKKMFSFVDARSKTHKASRVSDAAGNRRNPRSMKRWSLETISAMSSFFQL